ncbi:hypothetical protein QVD17_11766 [Tagetes erecta]|uniref:Transcription initiation factor TFIID subunit 12 domain-containing protein n=1 Tax=Tagetes erecta TaxID=13708 RepID=A0AAD8KV24_TARER|nr:hypothetical protein QVD17_11766 [Tagetes erecta]
MDQTPPTSSEPPPPTTTTTPTTTTSPEQQPQPSPPPPQQSPPPPTPTPTPTTSSLQPLPVNPNPNPKPPNLPIQSQPSQSQPLNLSRPQFNRPYPSFPHFSSITNHSTTSSPSIPPPQRGGMALGVPAHPAPQPPSSFSSLTPPSFPSQARQSVSAMQGVGMVGALGSSSSLRATGVASSLPQRPVQSSLRPQTSVGNPSASTQSFQEHGLLRLPSVGTAGSPASTTPQNTQTHNQPWLSSGTQGKPPLPPPSSFRPQLNPQTLQQRAHIPSQQQTGVSASAQLSPQTLLQTSSSLQGQATSLSQQTQDQHYTLPPSRVPQALVHQQQMARNRGLGNQRPFAPAVGHSSPVPPQPTVNKPPSAVEPAEPCNRIISKRSIQEIVAQIDPAERLDPEVEDILVDIADDFVESSFDVDNKRFKRLVSEKIWNMSLPGFSGDEIKCYKKLVQTMSIHFGNDVHRERLAAIKKSIAAAEPPSSKISGGQAAGGAKGHPAKTPGLVIGSPNPKGRETT